MLICFTNRALCKDAFLHRIHQLTQGKPSAIMLREKDLSVVDYESLAIQVKEICDHNQTPLIINQNILVAAKLRLPTIHLSMENIRIHKNEIHRFKDIGASVHSLAEAKEALELGATYLIAGHIFPTDCKKGVPPRGLSFLKEVCDSVPLPVFAIGGITKDRVKSVLQAGARGVCVMSEAMTCSSPIEFVKDFRS